MTRITAAAGVLLAALLIGGAQIPSRAAERGPLLEPMADLARAPGLTLERAGGGTLALTALRGKVVVINFWATWCGPCRREMPSLERLHATLKDPALVIVGIDAGETAEKIAEFSQHADTPPTYALVLDLHGDALKAFGVRGLPTTYVLDKQGRIAYRALGPRPFDDPAIVATLRNLIAAR